MPTESRKAIRTAAAWSANQAAMEALYGVGGYYTSLSLWEAGEQRDLVAADQVAVAVCYNDWPTGLNNTVSIAGWTTDATRKIVVTVAEGHRHTGVPKTGFFMRASSNFGHVVSCTADTEIEWLDAENTASAGFAFTFPRVIKNTLAKGGPEREAFRSVQSYSRLINCLAYGGLAGFGCVGFSAPTILNCVAANCTTGFDYSLGGSGYVLKNCVGYGNTTDYKGTASASSTNNASSNGTPPGSGPITGITSAAFVDAAGMDYHLAAGSPLIGAGANLYSEFQDDIDGDTRPSTGAWDIGFDHYAAAGGGTTAELAASGSATASATAQLAASIALAGVGVALTSGSAAPRIDIALSAMGLAVAAGTATPDAATAGSLAASGAASASGSAGPVASVTIAAAGLAQAAATAGLSADILRAGAGAAQAAGNAALAAQLAALAQGAAQASGTASIAATSDGSLLAAGGATASGTAALVLEVRLQAAGSSAASGSAAPTTGTADSLDAPGAGLATGAAQLSATVTLTAAGFVQAMGAGQVSIQIPLAAGGSASAGGSATLSAALVIDDMPPPKSIGAARVFRIGERRNIIAVPHQNRVLVL